MPNGDRIHGKAGDDNQNTAIGKDIQQVSVYADTYSWREFVRRDLEKIERAAEKAEARIMFLLIAVLVLFILGAFATGLVIREFDLTYLELDRQDQRMERRLERLERMIPTPTPWVWPNNMP